MSFAQRLKEERLKAGISQAQLAGERFSVSYISHLEAGRREPTAQVIEYLAERLGVDRGILRGAEWGTQGSRDHQPGDTALLAATTTRAVMAHRRNLLDEAIEAAQQGLQLAKELDRPEAWWQFTNLLADSYRNAGLVDKAAEVARELPEHPWVRQNPDLLLEAHLLASSTVRFTGDRDYAAEQSLAALALTADGHPKRLSAIGSALAAHAGDENQLVAEMVELVPKCADRHLAGLAEWILGNQAFQTGDTVSGLDWHRRADADLSPQYDFKEWARFARASADERIKAGVHDDVPELLERAEYALNQLKNPDELGELARTQARWHLTLGETQRAAEILREAIDRLTMPPITRGRTLLDLARVYQQLQDTDAAQAAALGAARSLTEAGARDDALDAWNLYDDVLSTGSRD